MNGVIGGQGGYQSAAEIEAQIAAGLGYPQAAAPFAQAGAPLAQPSRMTAREFASAPVQPVVAGVDITQGLVISSYGHIPLDPIARSMILGICSKAVRDHVANELEALNDQLGIPNVENQVGNAARALGNARAAGGPPPLNPALTQGANEGEDGPVAVRLTRAEALKIAPVPARRRRAS